MIANSGNKTEFSAKRVSKNKLPQTPSVTIKNIKLKKARLKYLEINGK